MPRTVTGSGVDAVEVGAQVAQAAEQRAERALAHAGVAVEADRADSQRRDRWQEAGDRPGQADVDARSVRGWSGSPVPSTVQAPSGDA